MPCWLKYCFAIIQYGHTVLVKTTVIIVLFRMPPIQHEQEEQCRNRWVDRHRDHGEAKDQRDLADKLNFMDDTTHSGKPRGRSPPWPASADHRFVRTAGSKRQFVGLTAAIL